MAVAVALFSAVRVTWLWALCWRSCWMSFSDSDRPVPSYLGTGHREAAARNQSSGESPGAAPALPIDGGSHEHQVRAQQVLHQGQRNGSSLVDHHELGLAQLHGISGVDVLQRRVWTLALPAAACLQPGKGQDSQSWSPAKLLAAPVLLRHQGRD